MNVLRGDPAAWKPPESGTAVTVGVFDGVHLGHQWLLDGLVERARSSHRMPAVVTFDPHPLAVVAPERVPPLLTTLEQRLELLGERGIEMAAVLVFDEHLRAQEPEAFVGTVLVRGLGARLVAVGEDFRFGKDRAGDAEALVRLGERLGFAVEVEPLVRLGEQPVSSTTIRRALAEGDVEAARRALGRCHELRGVVERGEGRGRQLGFPTANLRLPEGVAIPGEGIYAGWARLEGRHLMAAVSIGVRPTFGGGRKVVEAYLLDYEGELYGRGLALALCHRLRPEERFASVEELVVQMGRDVAQTRTLLEEAGSQAP